MNKVFYLPLFLAVCLFLSCSDDPNEVGIHMLPPQDMLNIDSVVTYATSDTTYLSRTTGSSTRLLIGSYRDHIPNIYLKSRMLLQFSGFTRVLSTATVDSAVLSFTINYRFKDSAGVLGFDVHKMLHYWNERTFTWDSSTVPGRYRTAPDTTFLQPISVHDSTIRLRIDTLVQGWISSGTNTPEGLILIPDTISSNIVLGMSNDPAAFPVLTIAYHNVSDTTVKLILYPTQSMFVADGPIPASPTLRYIQSGVAFRELLRFDSLFTRLPSRVSILSARLEIATDTGTSLFNNVSQDSILTYMARDNTLPYDTLAFGTLCQPSLDGAQKIFQADIKNIIQQWATNSPNRGIVLRTYNEFFTLDRVALYKAYPLSPRTPKIKILYTILP